MPPANSALPKSTNYMFVKITYKTGYKVTRGFCSKKDMKRYIDKKLLDNRISYIDVIPPQNYKYNWMEKEADKGGYSIEKYQKIFDI